MKSFNVSISVFVVPTVTISLLLLVGCTATPLLNHLVSMPRIDTGIIGVPFTDDPELLAERHFGVKRDTVDGIEWKYQGNVLGSTNGVFRVPSEVLNGGITIPPSLGGITITTIGPYYFMGCKNLTSVQIPETVRTISDMAFSDCKSLASVHLSQGVAIIGRSAFSNCKAMMNIDIPQSVTTIGEGAFQGCSGLTSVAIPKGVKVLEANTFSGCFGLVTVSLPEGLVRIGDSAFHSPLPSQTCADIRAVKLPSTLVTIGESAFNGCSGLTKIVIPDNVTTIGNYAFNDCSSLKATYIGKKVVRLGTGAFRHTGLTHVYVADGASVTLDDLHRAGIAEDCEVYRIYPDRRTERL